MRIVAFAALVCLLSACQQPITQPPEFFLDSVLQFDERTVGYGKVELDMKPADLALSGIGPDGYSAVDLAKEAETYGYKFVHGAEITTACVGGNASYERSGVDGRSASFLNMRFDKRCLVRRVVISRFQVPASP